MEGIIGTVVSYAGAVQGFVSRDPRQAQLPASRDWMSIETAMTDSLSDFEAAFAEAVEKLAADFNGKGV